MIKIATWNVNSIRARIGRVTSWLKRNQPDVLCLQEIKATNDTFPWSDIEEAGYKATIYGQASYNGVAIVHKHDAEGVGEGLDREARYIEATIQGVRIINVYVPQGRSLADKAFLYKNEWLNNLMNRLGNSSSETAVCGDFNIAPQSIDIAHPAESKAETLRVPEIRKYFEGILEMGYVDLFRKYNKGPGHYTFWEYRTDAFSWNDGYRIDHILVNEQLAHKSVNCWVDYGERGNNHVEKASDHAPVIARFR